MGRATTAPKAFTGQCFKCEGCGYRARWNVLVLPRVVMPHGSYDRRPNSKVEVPAVTEVSSVCGPGRGERGDCRGRSSPASRTRSQSGAIVRATEHAVSTSVRHAQVGNHQQETLSEKGITLHTPHVLLDYSIIGEKHRQACLATVSEEIPPIIQSVFLLEQESPAKGKEHIFQEPMNTPTTRTLLPYECC